MLEHARAFYQLFSGDAVVEQQVRDEAKALGKEIFLDGNGGTEITSATVNGQSFGGISTMTKMQRFLLLRLIIRMFDEDVAISSRSYFRGPS